MENSQYKLCREVIRRLGEAGALKHLIVIGSWCIPLYKEYFAGVAFNTTIRTRDVDFLIPKPSSFTSTIDLSELLKDLGFVVGFKGEHGVMRLEHPELMIEFLVPELGRGTDKPIRVPKIGMNAQALRFLNFLTSSTILVQIDGVPVKLPHPANFALHKLIVSERRKNEDKMIKDRNAGLQVLRALIEKGEGALIRKTFESAPRGWQQKILRVLDELKERSIIELLTD